MNEKFFGMIGIARRAGKVSIGADAVRDAVRNNMARLVILAEDASENTRKSVKNSCAFYNTACIEVSNAAELGRCIGKDTAAAISVNDDNLASAVSDKFNQG